MKKTIKTILVLLMAVTLCGCSVTDYYKEKLSSSSSTSKILVLCFTTETEDSVSDTVQAKNALSDGGQIFVYKSSEGYSATFGSDWKDFGALDGEGYYFIYGALLNYIADYGWKISAVSSDEMTIYFEK